MQAKGFTQHDHAHCIAETLRAVEVECAERSLQFTPVRRKALEVLLAEHRALGAYEVLEHLRDAGLGSQPPVAYRALDFLVSHGFAHRIELLNAFIACSHPGVRHAPSFLICRVCSAVAEAPGSRASDGLSQSAEEVGFVTERVVIEAEGLCPACVGKSA